MGGLGRGPSEAELAKAFLATEGRRGALHLLDLPTSEVYDLFDEMLDLPARHLSAHLRLPRLLPPELEALRLAIDEDDDDAVDGGVDPLEPPVIDQGGDQGGGEGLAC